MIRAVQLTSRGLGAIAVVLLAGEGAGGVVEKVFKAKRVAGMAVGEVVHSRLVDPGTQAALDDALVIRTGAQRYELHLHGGVAVMQAAMDVLEKLGVMALEPEHATAAVGWEMMGVSRLRAEVLYAMPRASTVTGARLLAGQVGGGGPGGRKGGLEGWARHWLERLKSGGADGALWRLQSAAQWLLVRSGELMRLLEPARIAIIGAPNAGKSTLANVLLGRPLSITSDVPGTTRDWVDAEVRLTASGSMGGLEEQGGGIEVPVILVDTAGVRETHDALERESIARTHQQARQADVLVVVLDATDLPKEDEPSLAYPETPRVVVVNKMDALGPENRREVAERFGHAVQTSAREGQGIDALMAAVLAQLGLRNVSAEEPFAFTPRQVRLIQEVAGCATMREQEERLREIANIDDSIIK